MHIYDRYIKRILDLLLAAAGAVILSPILLLAALAIRLDSPGPVMFRQKRVGKHKTYFEILKFRTMRTDCPKDVPTHLMKDPSRWLTRTGRFLRRTSIDELPQIFNILKGDMSIVGPRPALWNQYDLIEERDKYGANDVTPGLTGWAQVNGRDELDIEEKARLDGEYVRNLSFAMDLKCFLRTITAVIRAEGVAGEDKK
jgi:O-antigen biosynthesis protein WbqP